MWNYSNYGNDLNITKKLASIGSHQGACDNDIDYLMELPMIKRQLSKINPESLKKELKEYGAWDSEQLQDHNENLKRWLWISCGDILERSRK